MHVDSCYHDCSSPPTELAANPDISGIGVTLAYSLTAGLALLLVLVNYVLSYRPDVECSNELSQQAASKYERTMKCQPNPIDHYLLSWRLRHADIPLHGSDRRKRLEKAFTQCMLVMSDFQLVTGLSIMISGYTQLNCGLSRYHWQKIVQLSWFSSITHLCCLTFLSPYLARSILSQWRVPGMVILVVMLIIALVPTGQYNWIFEADIPQSELAMPAVCNFFPHWTWTQFKEHGALQRMAFSQSLLIVSMIVRLCRMYQAPLRLLRRIFQRLSRWPSIPMWKLYHLTATNSPFSGVVTILLYRPILGVFLCCRILINVALSRAFEVWWLALSLSWGALNLWHQEHGIEPESRQWNFGQVIAIVLLLAPFIALVEGYWSNIQTSSEDTQPAIQLANISSHTTSSSLALPSSNPSEHDTIPSHLEYPPNFNPYSLAAFRDLVLLVLLTLAVATIWSVKIFTIERVAPLHALFDYTLYTLSMSYLLCVNLALSFDKFKPEEGGRRRKKVMRMGSVLVFVAVFGTSIVVGFMGWLRDVELWLRSALIGVYFVLGVKQISERKRWRDV